MESITFCTLTNTGYANYTLNCLKSLEKIGLKDKLEVYCTDKNSYDIIKKEHDNTHYFHQTIVTTQHNKIIEFGKEDFGNTMKLKLMVIHECLKKNSYVLFTDGDIFYYKNGFFEYLLENIGDDNILCQNDKMEGCVSMGDGKPVCCAGFMFIKKNEETLKIYDMNTTDKYYREMLDTSKRRGFFDDQVYLRRLRNEHNSIVKMKLLPSKLFPTYFVVKSRKIPKDWDQKFLLHFNYIIGNDKANIMKSSKSWLI